MVVFGMVAAVYLAINLVAFAAFGIDKRAARRARKRISERTLLTLAVAGGGVGALSGRRFFRHKTRRWIFAVVPWAAILLHLSAWVAWLLI